MGFLADLLQARRSLVYQTKRIADALDRIAPPAGDPDPIKPEEAVDYVDEERMAKREMAEEMNELERWLREHPEEEEADVQRESD